MNECKNSECIENGMNGECLKVEWMDDSWKVMLHCRMCHSVAATARPCGLASLTTSRRLKQDTIPTTRTFFLPVCKHACMMHGCMDAWMRGCMYAWMHGFMDAWIHGCMDAWMHGCMDAWMHGCMDAWIKWSHHTGCRKVIEEDYMFFIQTYVRVPLYAIFATSILNLIFLRYLCLLWPSFHWRLSRLTVLYYNEQALTYFPSNI